MLITDFDQVAGHEYQDGEQMFLVVDVAGNELYNGPIENLADVLTQVHAGTISFEPDVNHRLHVYYGSWDEFQVRNARHFIASCKVGEVAGLVEGFVNRATERDAEYMIDGGGSVPLPKVG